MRVVFAFELRIFGLVLKKRPEGFLKLQLHIGKSQRIHFFQKRILLFILSRCYIQAFVAGLIIRLPVTQHEIPNLTATAKAFGKEHLLFCIWIDAVFIRCNHLLPCDSI